MPANETDRFVDQLLTASLGGYAAEQPRAGLEQRILARLADEPASPPWWTWRWLPVGALALVALLAAALLLFAGRETTRVAPPPQPPSVATAPSAAAPEVATTHPARPRALAPRTIPAPTRAAQFPTPGSLTEEERLLMRYLDSSPRELLVASVRTPGPLRNLHLREVEVPTLELKPLPEQSVKAIED